ncbi:MAG TPA: alpha/beta hydrolase [Euzebyales bacterium]|nr:alpha/beta hydrolase [Euzebyales bacterium]
MTATRGRSAFRADMRAARRRLATVHSLLAATRYGAVEYADHGSGPPVLVIHGVMGGVDAGLRNVACHVPDGYRIVVPSRFGYLRSSLPLRATPALQADAYAALLDALDIDRVAVIAASAGSSSALQFAIRHSDRVRALILVSPNVPGPHHATSLAFKLIAHALWRFNVVFWAAERYAPRAVLGLMGVPEGLPLSDADRATVQAELEGIFPIDQRIDGILFDTFTSNPDINTGYPLHAITAPTLLCHGRDDPGPPYHGAVRLTEQIPGATLTSWDRGGHIGLGDHPHIDNAIHTLLRDSAAAPTR